jgi:chorismate-pyruvate lyase
MQTSEPRIPELASLLALFYRSPSESGVFEEVAAEEMPQPYRQLLAHDAHMTVTMEEYHGSRVNVHVLATHHEGSRYCRKILLSRQSDGQIVQFGIVRLNLAVLSEEVQREIISQRTPLGRVLINHNVLREVELISLWRIQMGADLASLFQRPEGGVAYGRTALIYCNGDPAIELLEIVTPA